MNKRKENQASERTILAACSSVRVLASWIERYGLDNESFVDELELALLALQRSILERRIKGAR
ncbi:hypothetical protein ACN9MB_07410 [Dyella kyungheensis]|uniref:hypothetical protein n=1 Tax=Dyella kyungheensis TaxID=1242174 RepID=UPI003CF4ED98